jgi:hypothetical protein
MATTASHCIGGSIGGAAATTLISASLSSTPAQPYALYDAVSTWCGTRTTRHGVLLQLYLATRAQARVLAGIIRTRLWCRTRAEGTLPVLRGRGDAHCYDLARLAGRGVTVCHAPGAGRVRQHGWIIPEQ